MTAERDSERVVDVYMEASESTRRRRQSVVSRLAELESSVDIDRFQVKSWPSCVEIDGPNEDAIAVVEQFQQWAADAGVSLAPAFDRWSYDRSFTDESGEMISLPAVALAVYEDGEPVTVAPNGTELGTVDAVLAALDEAPEPANHERAIVDGLR